MTIKQQRLSNQIAKHLANIIQFEMKDPNLGLITITDVSVTHDLSLAKVYVMVSGNTKQKQLSLDALDQARGFIRSSLAKELTTYKTPEIRFIYDDSLDKAERIDELIKKTHQD